MADLTRVQGRVLLPDGTVPDGASLLFEMTGWASVGGEVVVPGPYLVPVGAAGNFEVSLYPSEDVREFYNVVVLHRERESGREIQCHLGRVSVPPGGPFMLSDIVVDLGETIPEPSEYEFLLHRISTVNADLSGEIGELAGDLEEFRQWTQDKVENLPADYAEQLQWVTDFRDGLSDRIDQLVGDLITLNVWINSGVSDLPGRLSDLAADISSEAAARIADVRLQAEQWRDQRGNIRAAIASALDAALQAFEHREELRATLSASLGDMSARYDQQIVVLADENQAASLAITQLEAASGQLQSQVQQVDQARIDGDSALASMIASLAVGTATQFDHTQIYYFDAGVEGWTGAPNSPSVVDGWLRPGSGSDLRSPAGLAVDGDAYRQVRARVRRVGSPTWQGWLWWAGEGEGWDSARRITLAEPSWDGSGIGLVTFEPGWTGGIDRLRIETASGGDGSNYHELDWVAVGRPAPGASSAELLAERQARIDGDEAVAEDVLALQGRMDDAEDGVGLNADAISGLTTRVGDAEGALGGHSTRLLSLEATVNDPATGNSGLASAIDQLEGSVLYDDGSQRYQAESIRDLRTQARRQAAQSVEAAATAAQTAERVREYLAEASQILGTRIDLTDDQVRIVAEAITTLQAAIPGLATATALQALTTRVEETEQGIESASQSIGSLQATINDPSTGLGSKLAASAITDYYTKTETNTVASSAASGATTALKSEMEGAGGSVKAAQDAAQAASDLAGGKGKVFFQAAAPAAVERLAQNLWIDTTGGANTPKRWSGSAWVAVQDKAATDALAATSTLQSTKADASAVSSLTTRVGDAEGEIEAFGDALTALGASVGPYTAKGLLRITAEAAPAGALARIGLTAVASDTEGSGRTAALFLEAIAGDKSQVIVQADRFAISDGSGRKFPFVIDGGEIILDAIGLRSANYAESGGVPTAGFSLDPATGEIRGKSIAAPNLNLFGGELKSGNFYAGSDGWRIQNNGDAEFNSVVIRRQLEVDSGSVNLGNITTNDGPGKLLPAFWETDGPVDVHEKSRGQTFFLKYRADVLSTAIPLTAWAGANRTYLANAGMSGTVIRSGSATAYWGWVVTVMPLTQWDGNQSLRLRMEFWATSNVTSVTSCIVNWKLYEVS